MCNFLKIQMPKLHLQRFIDVWARVLASSLQVKTCEKTSLNSHQWHLNSFWQLRKGLIRLSLTDTSNQEIRSYITITFYQITVYRNWTYKLNTAFAFSTHWWLLKAPYSRASETPKAISICYPVFCLLGAQMSTLGNGVEILKQTHITWKWEAALEATLCGLLTSSAPSKDTAPQGSRCQAAICKP